MQLTYQASTPLGIHGQKIEGWPSAIDTGLASAAVIPAGVIVIWDAAAGRAPESVKAPAVTGDITTLILVAGLALWDPTYPEPPYRIGSSIPIMRKGRFAIAAETGLNAHTNPFVRFATGPGGNVIGSLRNDADTASAVAAPYLTVVSGAATGGIAIVEINL
jgi:hypothetical protein